MKKIVVIVELDGQMGTTVGRTGQSCISCAHCSVIGYHYRKRMGKWRRWGKMADKLAAK